MPVVFADTGYFIASLDERDEKTRSAAICGSLSESPRESTTWQRFG